MKTTDKNNISAKLSDKTEFFAVDFFRLVFAIGIVALHLSPLENVNNVWNYFLVNVLTRLGVPFFFLVSGFFLQKKLDDFGKVKTYIVRLLQLYLIYTLLYLPQIIYGYMNGGDSPLRNAFAFMREFLFVGSYLQLWYFVALMAATLLLYWLVKKLRLSDKRITVIVLVIYVIGTILNAYIYPLKESLNVPVSEFAAVNKQYLLLWLYFKIFSTTRNGLFFGLPYLFFGYLIAKNKHRIYRKNYFLLAVLSFIVMTGEAFAVVKVFGGCGQDMLFALLPTSIFVFLFLLFIDCKSSPGNIQMAKHCRYLSVLYFGLHMFISFYIGGILKKVFDIELHSIICFAVVVVLNYIAAEVIIHMSDIPYFKWLKKFY